ncbi:hypothetical protein OG521_18130 [Streptomyces sp. NBC_01463]|uniref:hypothetical protein n=1 Tax=Streptomyces sp. RTGN2 TaxID=3016525 RepID=UPI002554F29A|nr:hypothetical protein [Streptomyces sp. RTGN2]
MQRTWGSRIKHTTVALIGAAALLTAVHVGTDVADGAARTSVAGGPTESASATPLTSGPGNEDWN